MPGPRARHRLVWAAVAWLTAFVATAFMAPAWAQAVSLSGVVGNRALLQVDGSAPKMVAPGETFQGVRVISAQSDQAQVEVGGKRVTLRMGESPVNVGGAITEGKGSRIVLASSGGGHFTTAGLINGKPVQFVVDTGATVVSIGTGDATRLGINYLTGQRVGMMTANGQAVGYLVRLESIRIADVQVFDVQAVVTTQPMPVVLLGNSFLSRFSMRRDGDQMVLERRY